MVGAARSNRCDACRRRKVKVRCIFVSRSSASVNKGFDIS